MTHDTATTHPAPKRLLLDGGKPVEDWRILSRPKPTRKMEG